MWGAEQQEAFDRDGHVVLERAFDSDAAHRMAEAIWGFVETRSAIRRDEPSTWPSGFTGVSLKRLKSNSSFRAVLDSADTRAALDGIFENAWTPSGGGAQILLSFPDTTSESWRVPSNLWHMDSDFHRHVAPPRAVKLFSVVEPLPPRSGATMALTGTPNLQEAYAREVSADERRGDKQGWHRFMRQADPWLARFVGDDDSPDRNDVLSERHVIGGHGVELRELSGEPGDVHVCHINLFHSVAPHAGDRPRVVVTHVVRGATPVL